MLDVYNDVVQAVIGKDGFLSKIPVAIIALPVSGLLQVFNSAINNFFTSFIQLVPRCRESARDDLKKLNEDFAESIEQFADNVYNPIGGGIGSGDSTIFGKGGRQ